MEYQKIDISPFEPGFREQVLTVWERSVLATHHFLHPSDFLSIRDLVHAFDFISIEVHCLQVEEKVAGFIGVAEKKVEMLFLDPGYFGNGYGRRLMDFAITSLGVDRVDVNEQNAVAVEFYRKFGFDVYERTERDDQGNNYPLLRMKLASNREKHG